MNNSMLRNSSQNRQLNDSAKTISQGDPGSMQAMVVVPLTAHQSRSVCAMNSGPLSARVHTSRLSNR